MDNSFFYSQEQKKKLIEYFKKIVVRYTGSEVLVKKFDKYID